MASESRLHKEATPASKTRLIRYAIDRFLLQVSQSMAPGTFLLDSGAGSCKHRKFFPQARILSFDNRQSRRRRYGEIDFVGDLYAIPFSEDTFDVALNIEVLEHLREPKRALEEIYRVLRPEASYSWSHLKAVRSIKFRMTISDSRVLAFAIFWKEPALRSLRSTPWGGISGTWAI
jgi:SAM-dependent methyltransferase